MFKRGDKVRCINNRNQEDLLELGKVYTVLHADIMSHPGNLRLAETSRSFIPWKHRFVLARQEARLV